MAEVHNILLFGSVLAHLGADVDFVHLHCIWFNLNVLKTKIETN